MSNAQVIVFGLALLMAISGCNKSTTPDASQVPDDVLPTVEAENVSPPVDVVTEDAPQALPLEPIGDPISSVESPAVEATGTGDPFNGPGGRALA